ncbi:uncharacterized protein RCC_07496 [Ramularia collo-cygni]|uniref:Uncharacterized protein n=1 Tax=Ramularia collo-cygni TaxID=112498 RepID=A0A2D3UXP7_9PEZI|nr:uncharacterized protein RCC_07496 [Ramularia collo-cygni]CZT21631.1 uncharacterized protein RCC_07496 [Ramularia collo-cygni]
MGGNAFAHAVSGNTPTLYTPRVTPKKYDQLKQLYELKLRRHLPGRQVNILKEAPEKRDYGDLDFVIESAHEPVDWQILAGQIGAAGLIIHSSDKVQSCSVAVPMDGSASAGFTIYKLKHNLTGLSMEVTKEEYAQIDLGVVPKELFEWHSFYSSFGDMSGMLGHMVHNLGFTICDRGLMLRLAELEAAKDMTFVNIPDTCGKLFLSKDPQKLLDFLGLSYDTYQQGFDTADDLYRWLCQCRLLSKDSIKVKRDDANGRQKERKRPVYSTFFNDWLPAYLETSVNHTADPQLIPASSRYSSQRQDLALEAVAFFDKRTEYERMSTALVYKIKSQSVENLLKPIISQHSGLKEKKLAEVVRSFRRWVGFQGEIPYILNSPNEDEQSELYKFLGKEDTTKLRDEEGVGEWVKGNWEMIKALERERAKVSKSPV